MNRLQFYKGMMNYFIMKEHLNILYLLVNQMEYEVELARSDWQHSRQYRDHKRKKV